MSLPMGRKFMRYQQPSTEGALLKFKSEYGNFIGGKWLGPMDGQFFEVICPVSGQPYTRVPRSNSKDIELALDGAHAAFEGWKRTVLLSGQTCCSRLPIGLKVT